MLLTQVAPSEVDASKFQILIYLVVSLIRQAGRLYYLANQLLPFAAVETDGLVLLDSYLHKLAWVPAMDLLYYSYSQKVVANLSAYGPAN